MSNGWSASVLVPLSSLVRPQRISWRAASRHIHELRRHRETLRPAGQHSRRGVAPVCSLERVRPLERDTGPSEGLRLRFGKEKTLAARDNSVGILGAGGTEAESRHPRVQRDHMNGSRRLRSVVSCGRGAFSGNRTGVFPEAFFAPSPSIWEQPVPSGGLQARWELALGLRHAEKLALPLLGCLRVMPEEVPSGEKKSVHVDQLPLPFSRGSFPEGQEGGYHCCRKCEEEIRRLRREAQNKPVLRSQGHSQLQPLGHVRTQNST